MVSWSNLEKLCSCSRTWMVSALACGNKWIQVGTYSCKVCASESVLMVWYMTQSSANSLTVDEMPETD